VSRPIAVIDCETDPFLAGRVPEPFIWGWYDGAEFRYWEHEQIESFIEFISKRKCIVYAHNGGKFDYHFLKPWIKTGDEIMVINGRLARFKIGHAEFRDSWNIIPAKLAAYEKTVIDYSKFEREVRYKTENWREIVSYLSDDCVNLFELVSRFIDRFGMRLTQAGASMNEWQKISEEKPEDSGEEFFKAFQPYYYGGRVQCFQRGVIAEPFKVLDINSAYPYAMLHDHPRGLDYVTTDGYVEHAHFFRLVAQSTGVFPYRNQLAHKLEFPADNAYREFFITHWELQAAIDTDCLRGARILESTTFEQTGSFEQYIEQFYNERLKARAEKDKVGDLFAKLFMNSLYGKWAANPEGYKTYVVVESADDAPADAEFTAIADFGGHLLMSKPLDSWRRRYYNVCTAASITGFVRAMLWEAIHGCGLDNMLYCDTDSIASKLIGPGIELGTKLGQWKDEGDFVRAAIAGKKLYAFESAAPKKGLLTWDQRLSDEREGTFKVASKGTRLTPAELFDVARGGTVYYSPEVPTFTVVKDPHFTARKIVATR
jgi:hypothetical protein